MRVFITGPLGYIGKPIAEAFRSAGHQVRGLVRTHEKAKLLLQAEIEPIIGDLSHAETYLHAIEQAEVIVHCALDSSPSAIETESLLLDALLEFRYLGGGASKTVLYTSGVWVVGSTGSYIADESSPMQPIGCVQWRSEMEERLLKAATRRFRPVVMRPGCVYGGSGGLTSLWFSSALRGAVEIVGEGCNHWSMVHQRDLAQAYLLAAEKEMGSVALNIVDHSHYTVREMAIAVSEIAGIANRIERLKAEEAAQKYGKMLEGLLIDQHLSNGRAERLLGWHPRQRSFIDGIHTFYRAWKAMQ